MKGENALTATLRTKSSRPNYYISIRYRDDTGAHKTKWITTDIPVKGNNKRRAEQRLKEVLAEYEQQKVDLSKEVLFTVFMAQWLENHKHSIASTTYDGYKLVLKTHILPYFQPKKLKVRDVTPLHIQQYINHKMQSISPNTVIKHLRNISKCLDSAVRQNLIAFNPVSRIDKPKRIKYTGAKYYNEKQIEQLLECSKGDPLEMVILLTVYYGLRRSEVLGLKWDAVDMVNNVITIRHTVTESFNKLHKTDATKNDSSYAVIPMPDMIKAKFKWWKARQAEHRLLQPNDYNNEGYICTQIYGSLIKPSYVSQHFKVLLKKNNMPIIRFHDLRHSAAGYLRYLGFDLKDIQIWLRHSDISTTANIYLNLDMSAKTAIANKLSEKFSNFIGDNIGDMYYFEVNSAKNKAPRQEKTLF